MFDNLRKHSVDGFDSGHALNLHIEEELLGNHLVQGLHVLTVFTHKFLNCLATRLVVNLLHWVCSACMVDAENVRLLMNSKRGYIRSLKFLVM